MLIVYFCRAVQSSSSQTSEILTNEVETQSIGKHEVMVSQPLETCAALLLCHWTF